MGYQKYLKELYRKPTKDLKEIQKSRLIEWRAQPSTVRVDRPTRLDRAHSVGYKAKQGVIIVRQRVDKGGRARPKPAGGRKPKKAGLRKYTPKKSHKWIAEERCARAYPNMEVLNSYWLAEDGKNAWFEVILVDKHHPAILKDKQLSMIAKQEGRVHRGKTSAGRKSRGLRHKGEGAEKLRPSLRANKGKGK